MMKRTGNSFENLKSPTLVKKSGSKNEGRKINSALSREDLLDMEKEYFANEQKVMRQRRTKIIATLGDKSCSVDLIKELYHAGMNVIRINLAYCDQKTMEVIMKNKFLVEKELNVFIPVIADLKGTTTRLGVFNDGEVHLKKGDEFRISTNKKIVGDKNIVSCDEEDLGKIVKVGDMILIDYGQISLKVIKIEKESESLVKLREKHAMKYAYGFPKKQKGTLKSDQGGVESLSGVSEEDFSEKLSNEEQEKPTNELRSSNSMSESDEPRKPVSNSKRSKFNAAFKSGKKKVDKDVLLLEAMNDCLLMSNKALFILKAERKPEKEKEVQKYDKEKEKDPLHSFDGDDEEDQACITVKDVKDMNSAIKLGVDCIAISGVHSARDINDARFILGKQSQMRIIAKIQDTLGVEKFDEILQAADAIVISRAYLTIHTTVEKLYFKQKEMIKKCHEAGKPVIIVGQLLESMVLGLVPSTSEINDISGLILDGVDSLALVSETTFGSHKKEAIETLSRICYEVEYNEVQYNKKAYSQTNNMNAFSHPNPFVSNVQLGKMSTEKNTTSISQAIADCVIKAVYDLGASLIVSFTSTGSTVLKISKRRSPCPIIAVTTSEYVARQVSTLSSVTAVKVGSFFGSEGLTPRVIAIAKDKNWVKSGDYIVVTHGDLEGIPGSTNSLKIVKVP